MRKCDFDEFAALLDAVCGLLSRGGSYIPSSTNTAMFFRALSKYSLSEVRAALDAHVIDPQRGRFVPLPADIMAQLERLAADDGRPGADEAWGVSILAADERCSFTWTREMAQAWAVAKSVYFAGDCIGARVAFRATYERLVGDARRDRRPVEWRTSLGSDKAGHEAVLRDAVSVGRLPATALLQLQPPDPEPVHVGTPMPSSVRAALQRLCSGWKAARCDGCHIEAGDGQ